MALQTVQSVVISDVADSPLFLGTQALEVLLNAGVRAVQSTPLMARTGRVIGMISTHHRRPTRLGACELDLIRLLAHRAATLLEQGQRALVENQNNF